MLRYAQIAEDPIRKELAIMMAKEMHEAFYVPGRGYRLKLNVDLSPLPGRLVHPTHGAVQAYVLFNIINDMGGDVAMELKDLEPVVASYFSRPVRSQPFLTQLSDLLGIGQHLWTMQWLGDEVCGVNLDQYKSTVYQRAQILVPHAFEERERSIEALINKDKAMMMMGEPGPCLKTNHDTTGITDHSVENIVSGINSHGCIVSERNSITKYHEPACDFRLYGALLGAQLTAREGLEEMSDPFVDRAAQQFPDFRPFYEEANVLAVSSVMLASSLNSRVFQRTAQESIAL